MSDNRWNDAQRWHDRNGHEHFVRTAHSLGWNDTFIYNVCTYVQCQTRAIIDILEDACPPNVLQTA